MQFSTVAILAAAATTVSAGYGYSNASSIVYTTDIVTAYTTYCPAATEVTMGESTYTVTEATTLTVTNCPCTIVKPVTTSSVVAPTYPVYSNATTPATTSYSAASTSAGSVGTTSSYVASATPVVPASSGNKAVAFSGFSLAGVLAIAVYIL